MVLVVNLTSTHCTVREAIEQIAIGLQHHQPTVLFTFAIEILADLMRQRAIIGGSL